jgi:formylglycine-generating enzyme required for sulfatase activity
VISKIFLNYRRAGADAWADRLNERLKAQLPGADVFMDIDGNIPLGLPWAQWLDSQVAACDLMLVLIGRSWDSEFEARSAAGERDFVRVEIEMALARKIPVVPILLADTPVPSVARLPASIHPLLELQATRLRRDSFDADAKALIDGVQRSIRLARGEAVAPARPARATVAPIESYRAQGRIKVDAKHVHGTPEGWFLPGKGKTEWFKDLDAGPEMVVVPAGSFMMGSPESEPEREGWKRGTESPHHKVSIARPFAVGRHSVTRGQFAAFVNNTGYKTNASWRNPGFAQEDSHPAVFVSWDDAKAYAAWLMKQSGQSYRLLTETEWEYAARAGTTTPFWWGSSITPSQANYNGNHVYAGGGGKGEYRKQTVAVESFMPNTWGLFNVHGNVWEWCEDIWHDDYNGAPVDGSAWLLGGEQGRRVVRGGSWDIDPLNLRSASRYGRDAEVRSGSLGFRLSRTLL